MCENREKESLFKNFTDLLERDLRGKGRSADKIWQTILSAGFTQPCFHRLSESVEFVPKSPSKKQTTKQRTILVFGHFSFLEQ